MNTRWMDDALCREVDPELFHPHLGENTGHLAKRICNGCTVKNECLEYALAQPGIDGILGGTTYKERQRMNTARRKNGLAS